MKKSTLVIWMVVIVVAAVVITLGIVYGLEGSNTALLVTKPVKTAPATPVKTGPWTMLNDDGLGGGPENKTIQGLVSYRDKIYAPQLGQVIVVLAIMPGAGYKLLFLGVGNRFFRATKFKVALGSNFNKNQVFLMGSYNIQFTFRAAVISF